MHDHPERSHLWPGVPLALGSALRFGASAPLSKLLMGSISPWLLAGILYLGAGIGLAITHYAALPWALPKVEASLKRADLPWLAAVLFFGGFLGPLLLMFGLSMTSASSGSLLLNLEGLATMAIARVVFRENAPQSLHAMRKGPHTPVGAFSGDGNLSGCPSVADVGGTFARPS